MKLEKILVPAAQGLEFWKSYSFRRRKHKIIQDIWVNLFVVWLLMVIANKL